MYPNTINFQVEDTSNGAVACQLLDVLHPGTVPMSKVDFNANNEVRKSRGLDYGGGAWG